MKKTLLLLTILLHWLVFVTDTFSQGANCAAAINIPVNSVTSTFSISAAAGSPSLTGCGSLPILSEGWFSFTATTNYSVVTFLNLGTQTGYVYIYSGVCGGLGEMTCMNITTSNINLLNFNTVSGQIYRIRVVQVNAGGTVSGRLGVYSNSGTNAMLCKPDKSSYSTGSANQSGAKSDNIMTSGGPSPYILGFMKFNTSAIPKSNINVNGIAFSPTCQTNGNNGPSDLCTLYGSNRYLYTITAMKNPATDPVTATGAQIYTRSDQVANFYTSITPWSFSAGVTYSYVLNNNAITNFNSYYTQNWWGVNIPIDWASCYSTNVTTNWYGWNSQYLPYILVMYTPTGCLPISISLQPNSPSNLCSPASANFTVTADGTPPFSYQWQVNNSGWTNISDGGTEPVYTGSSTSVLQVSNATSNKEFRCIITNCSGANTVTSSSATFSVCSSEGLPTLLNLIR